MMKVIHLPEHAYEEANRLAAAEGVALAELLQRLIDRRVRRARPAGSVINHPGAPVNRDLHEWREELL